MTGAVQEYTVRVPRSSQKHHCIMQFNSSLMVDFAKWNNVKMVREVPIRHIIEEDSPKFGAGSEFGKDAREEARKKKFGYVTKKHPKEKYPWVMKVGGKLGKRYRGVRGGSITENASYYVFTQAKDGAFEAFPVSEWYNFQHVQRYKALSAEEAEEQFNKRDKIMNYFSVMMKKRLKKEDDAEVDGEKAEEKVGKKKSKDLKISDLDEWPDSSDDNNSSNEENSDQDVKKKKKKDDAKSKSKRKFRKSNIKDEAFEDSDDGDEEGREMDYISDSSESGQEEKQEKEEKGVDQEDALKRLLDSDAEVEASSEEEKNEEEEDEKKSDGEDTSPVKKKVSKEKASKAKSSQKDENSSGISDSGDSCSMDQTDCASSSTKNASDKNMVDSKLTAAATKKKTEQLLKDIKRKADEDISPSAPKRAKVEFASTLQISNDTGITEDAVRRYLTRKPMTTTELLQKFKSKKVGLSSDQLVPVIAQILKKINPTKQMVKGKMYLSIKK